MSYQILPYNIHSPLIVHAAQVYATVWQRDERDSLAFFRRHARYPKFYGLVARLDHRIIGLAFGVAALPEHWWHEQVAQQIGADHPALQEAWILTELAVLAQFRTRHIGADLHDQIIKMQPYHNLLLSTQVSNTSAQEFYRRRSWDVLHPGFAFNPGQEPYMVMYRRLSDTQ